MAHEVRKIALINPGNPIENYNPMMSEMYQTQSQYVKPWAAPPLSLLTIAALTPPEIEIVYINERFERIDFNKKYDLVGITAMTHQAIRAYEIADNFRERNIPVVMGGLHVSVMTNEALDHVNTVIIGEAEDIWPVYLEDFRKGKALPIYKASQPFNLQKAPISRYDLVKFDHYKNREKFFNFIPVQATRGCPHDCIFCLVSQFYGKKPRLKKVEQVISEIDYLKSMNPESVILFADDNLFVNKKYAKNLLRELIPLKIKFVAQTDVRFAEDDELLNLAYLAGCELVYIGFESINYESLEEINKNQWKQKQLNNYELAIERIQAHGIVTLGSFVIGFKNDTLKTFTDIKNFAVKNNIPGAFTLLTPLPGTRLYHELETEGRLHKELFWNKCDFYSLLFKHDYLTPKEAEKQLTWLHHEVYSQVNAIQRAMHMKRIYKNLPPRWINETTIQS